MTAYDFSSVYAGLKDFQQSTVDYVFKRMYLDDEPTQRFLVADEVGLGKTLVARGLIGKVIEHLQNEVKRIDIIYICSNATIARQNVQRLNITGSDDFSLPDRITLLPLHLDQMSNSQLNFISFTPGTALDLKHRTGTRRERALLYWMLRLSWKGGLFDGVRPMNLFQGNVTRTKDFRAYLRDFEKEQISQELLRKFKQAVRESDRASRESGSATYKQRFIELLDLFSRSDKAIGRKERDLRNGFIGDLRALLARSCIDALEPDLIILDEFQRFKHLLDGSDPAAGLAHDLFDYESARVLLLSATPYKMYTISEESEEDDHYKDFLRTIEFLMPNEVEDFTNDLQGFRRALFGVDENRLGDAVAACSKVEQRLKKVLARTERLALTPDRAGMLKEVPMEGLKLKGADVKSYLAASRLASRLDAGDVMEYWKSAPYLLNFMEHYELVDKLEAAEDEGLGPELAELLSSGDGLLPEWEKVARWDEIDPANARLRALVADTVETGAWRLLWMPPSLPYYRPGPPYDSDDIQELTKRLVFSAWTVVPKALAALVSYEAERRMVQAGARGASYDNTPEDRKRVRPLLRWHRSEGRLQGMALLALVYPSPALAAIGDPLRLCADQMVDSDQLLQEIKARLQKRLAPLVQGAPSSGPIDESWYWAAPLLLDNQILGLGASDWLADPHLASQWGVDDDSYDHGDPLNEDIDEELTWDQLTVGHTYNFRNPGGHWHGYVLVGKTNDEALLRRIWFDADGYRRVSRTTTRLRGEVEIHTLWSKDPVWRDVPAPETLRAEHFYALRFGSLKRHGSFRVDEVLEDEYLVRRVHRDKANDEIGFGKTYSVKFDEIDLWIDDETESWGGLQVQATGVLGQVLTTAQRSARGERPTGRVPEDLFDVLARIALGSPANSALRALSRVVEGPDTIKDPDVRVAAAGVAWSFRNLFNLPDVTSLLRASAGSEPYWRLSLDYCVNGNLQSVLDEHAHVLPEWLGLIGRPSQEVANRVSEAMKDAISLRAASYTVDEIRPEAGDLMHEQRRLRGRFAVRFGKDRGEDGTEVNRSAHARAAFNSPFWPFVLATTSVGQEGLDFHLYCHAVVHWNLPANPVDLEQREGRVHRYKGHAVRKNLAKACRERAFGQQGQDPWQALFAAGEALRTGEQNDLFPYWVFPLEDGAHIERYVPMLPLSREEGRFKDLRRTLGAYRLVFGQPRQEDLIAFLRRRMDDEEISVLLDELKIDLAPPTLASRSGSFVS